jgi:hypothetical protein
MYSVEHIALTSTGAYSEKGKRGEDDKEKAVNSSSSANYEACCTIVGNWSAMIILFLLI